MQKSRNPTSYSFTKLRPRSWPN